MVRARSAGDRVFLEFSGGGVGRTCVQVCGTIARSGMTWQRDTLGMCKGVSILVRFVVIRTCAI